MNYKIFISGLLLLIEFMFVFGQGDDKDLPGRISTVKGLARQLMLEKLDEPGLDRLLEPWETLEMLNRCKELMPKGIAQVEGLSSAEPLVDWWQNLDNYIGVSVVNNVKCKQGNFMPYLVKFSVRRYPNMVNYVEHYKKEQEALCRKVKV